MQRPLTKFHREGIARLLFLLLVIVSLGQSGCSRVESEFVYSPQTQELMPAAREKLQQSLRHTFGSPAAPRIPHYFPVDRGGLILEVADFDPEQAEQLMLEPVGETRPQAGQPIEFLFDPEAAFDVQAAALEEEQPDPLEPLRKLVVAQFNPAKNLLTVSHKLPDVELLEPGLELAINANEGLRRGSELYAQHCLHCHGVTGDGKGPTAAFMKPQPRDYRLGIFKYTSTGPQDKVSTADLKNVLKEGVPGTYMPSFNQLPETDLDQLVSYVKFLAIRGETENNLVVELGLDFSQKVLNGELEGVEDPEERQEITEGFEADLADFLKVDYPEIELGVLLDLVDAWAAADEEDAVLYPSIPRTDPNGPSAANPELTSLENGRLLYLGNDAQCASCHGDAGKGNGFQTRQFQKQRDGTEYAVAGLHDIWGFPLPPRDLTSDIYRGGRRPIDVFRRIYGGIKGTPMPVFGGRGLTDAQIWDIVNYVLEMPYEQP